MARYTGPKVRLSRRLSTNLFENEKGRRALERRPFPPGTHGRTRRRNNGSEYLAQLQEKQKAKYIYGVLERQFQRTYEEANRLAGPDRREPAAPARAAPRQRHVPRRLGVDPPAGPPVRQPRPGATSTASASTSPATACARATSCRCRRRPANMIVIQHNIDMLDRSLVGWLEARRRRQAGHRPRPAPARAHRRPRPRAAHRRALLQVITTGLRPLNPEDVTPPKTERRSPHHARHAASHHRGHRRRGRQPSALRHRPARARLRPHPRQLAAPHPAVVDPRRGHHDGPLRRRAARVRHHHRCRRGRHRHHPQPQGHRRHVGVVRPGHLPPRRPRRRRGHRR